MEQYGLTDEQKMLREMVEKLAREKVAPRAAEIDAKAEYPQDMFELLKSLDLFALPFPTEYGGTGSILSACIAVEELARVCYNTAYLLVVQWVPFGAILHGGTEAQKAHYLPKLASGELRGALGVTESHAGSDVSGIKTRADRVEGGYRLNGGKIFCSNSALADFALIAAKTDPDKKHDGIAVFIVDTQSEGFIIARDEPKMGARGIPSSELHFDDIFVPEENMLGAPGKGFKLVMEAFNKSRPIIGARAVGLSQGAMDLSVKYVKDREAFGQPIANFQGVQWIIADMAIQNEAARQLVYKAAAMVDAGATGQELAPMAAISKCFSTDVAMKIATDALQLYGSQGVSKDNPIERYFRDAKVLQIIEGTNQIQRNIVGKHIVRTTS